MLNTEKILNNSGLDFETGFFGDYLHHVEFNDFTELMAYLDGDDNCNCIQDSVSEYADSSVDVYNYNLRVWAAENYDYVEQAVDEGLVDTNNFDYHKAIQCGQYIYYQEKIYEDIEALKEHIQDKYEF